MMMQILCLFIGRLLLICISAYELLQQLWLRLQALAHRSYDYWQRDQCEFFGRAARELQKVPQHLVLVVAPDDRYVDASLLKRIFGYAQIVGIPCISLYDTRTPQNGYIQLSDFCQRSEKADRCHLWPPKRQQNGCKASAANGIVNGYTNNGGHYAQLQVYQIGSADGHALIADVCREMYENRSTSRVQEMLKQRQTLTDGINGMLNKRLCFPVPEPELGIVFSRQTCTYGLLPWHVRFTEFHTHRSGSYFNAKSFAKVLYKYARCEQRWGK